MNKRDVLEVAARAMGVYFVAEGILSIVRVVSTLRLQSTMLAGAVGDTGVSQMLPAFAYPIASVLAGLILWKTSKRIAERAFPEVVPSGAQVATSGLQRAAAYLISTYFIVTGSAGVVEFFVRFAFGPRRVEFPGIGVAAPHWEELAVSIAYVVAGLMVHFGVGKITGTVKHVGDNVADMLWRIKPKESADKENDRE